MIPPPPFYRQPAQGHTACSSCFPLTTARPLNSPLRVRGKVADKALLMEEWRPHPARFRDGGSNGITPAETNGVVFLGRKQALSETSRSCELWRCSLESTAARGPLLVAQGSIGGAPAGSAAQRCCTQRTFPLFDQSQGIPACGTRSSSGL